MQLGLNTLSSAKYFLFMGFLTVDLILLGAAVRIFDAGLACPDWPLCFGKVIPDYHPIVYLEFAHRALAGAVGILYLLGLLSLIINKGQSMGLKWLSFVTALVLLTQIILGALTVILNLHFGTVVLHLGLALVFCFNLFWIGWSLKCVQEGKHNNTSEDFLLSKEKWGLLFCLLVTFGQTLLGGAVASNYAGLVCIDFPLCHGEFIPTLRGIIGIQILHRLGAYFTFAVLFSSALYFFKKKKLGDFPKIIALLISLQLIVGASNILWKLPPLLSLFHLLLAVLLLLTLGKMLHRSLHAYLKHSERGKER